MIRYWNKVVSLVEKKACSKTFQKVRDSKPIQYTYNPELVIVSQVYSGALDMSLLALKSFIKMIGEGRVEVIDDGSLTKSDHELLHHHIPHLTIVHIDDIDVGSCPKGSCWERLIHILKLSQDAYVIQVDTDTLTIAPVPEVYNGFKANKAFTIGGEPNWPEPIPVEYISHISRNKISEHIQVKSERQLEHVESINLTHYCRGCAAFAGFPKQAVTFDQLQAFSAEMEERIGADTWRNWGSEQFSANVMISLCPEPSVLPWPKYLNHGFPFVENGQEKLESYTRLTSVLHFIGTYRYKHGVYRKLAKLVLSEL
ncbi:hypothetical protein [Catenovulum maritimum]|uniref:Uncharacterized protein n=1 Tax=Catenovulum maritimum TaxID=1513271 RepID=A0A0J8GPD6_9ALTE|nr:hypothetical protein [Catenovulum maritimum]KMT64637.1 hypothetical protein XM47_13425 [Catenovulum maritimum]